MEGELCSICQKINLQQYLFEDLSPGTITLGGFQDIAKKSECPLCRLIIQALGANSRDYWDAGIYPSEACYFGRQDGRSRPSILEVWFDSTSETLPEGICGHITTRGEILLVSDNSKAISRRPTNPGRPIGSQIEMSVLRGWLSSCETCHGDKCEGLKTKDPSASTKPLILVDVVHRRLVECSPSCRYITLSYVWGKVSTFQTSMTNFSELQRDDALTRIGSKIPRVIRDSIDVVANLGEKYLWVDTLCIVQDGPSKLAEISRMDAIYGGAVLTIVACAGVDANANLPGLRLQSRHSSQSFEIIDDMCLVNKLPELAELLQESRWESRAWTFQERILSKRCLYFTDSQVYFECCSGIFREDIFGEYSQNQLIRSGAGNPLEMNDLPGDGYTMFNIYENLVKSYNQRELSHPSDALCAFSGIISALQKRFGWRFLSALPEDLFHLALLWRPIASSSPRFANMDEATELPLTISPSWCWTSWTSHIYWDPWRTHAYAGNKIHLKSKIEQFTVRDGAFLRNVEPKYGDTDTGGCLSTSFTSSPYLDGVNSSNKAASAHNGSLHKTQILYFLADAVQLSALRLSSEIIYPKDYAHPISRFRRGFSNQAWLYDTAGHHCGTLTGIESWPPEHSYDTKKYDLVLLSWSYQRVVTEADIKASLKHLPLEYLSSHEYYDEIFDTYHYQVTEDWSRNIMLIEWRGEYAERVAIGQIHANAWERSNPQRKVVRLA
ncbi:hypothetical protein OIDMADRAFT_204534 [Oidiodendron maius Zn]|uniref:Heterokaryon incompatibility domain-containing protein n=1 Tax=Oidiodendron maius (strain Zn) TaxID=913774 RepID=A0A0C3H2L2_OIDMZ|nr:hypothetical protein OIDMADRAFT_204534 [Oidiodendron maius Zn]